MQAVSCAVAKHKMVNRMYTAAFLPLQTSLGNSSVTNRF